MKHIMNTTIARCLPTASTYKECQLTVKKIAEDFIAAPMFIQIQQEQVNWSEFDYDWKVKYVDEEKKISATLLQALQGYLYAIGR